MLGIRGPVENIIELLIGVGVDVKEGYIACCLVLLLIPGGIRAASEDTDFRESIGKIEAAATREEALLARGGNLGVHWIDGGRFLYLPDMGRHTVELVDPAGNTIERLAGHSALHKAFAAAGKDPEQCEPLGLGGESSLRFLCGDEMAHYDYRNGNVRVSEAEGQAERLRRPQVISNQFPTTFGPLTEAGSPDGRSFITVIDHNLYLRSADDASLRPLTEDGHLRKTWLNTQESAQKFNVFWSADSRSIATVQLDTREVWHEPLLDLLSNPPGLTFVAYPRAGEPIHRFRLFFIDVRTGKRQPIKLGDTSDLYVDIIGWQGDDKGLLIQLLDREHKVRQVVRADRYDGEVTVLHDDVSETYHDSWMTLFIDFVVPLKSSNGFLYLSEESGWRHIVHHDGTGSRVGTVTSGSWAVDRIVHVDESAGFVYFLAATDPDQPYDLQFYRVPMAGDGDPQLLSHGAGRTDVAMSPDGSHFVSRTSSPMSPPVVELRRSDGTRLAELSRFDASGLFDSGFAGMETIAVPDATGRWLQYITIIKPYGFQSTRSYPVIEKIYGGMQSGVTKHQFYGFGDAGTQNSVTRALLHAGYVVVMVDSPGTPGRGRAFQDVTFRRWPQGVIADHVQAISTAASSRPWMDLERLGVYGHSWGAYMAQRAMIEAPDFYRAAVVHNGGSDFHDQPTYIEPFMGLPKNNPAGYAAGSNLALVGEIKGPMLAFTAPYDVNSGFSPAFKLVDAMMSAGKDIELFIPPRNNHRLPCCSRSQELYKLTKVIRFFDREVNGSGGETRSQAGAKTE